MGRPDADLDRRVADTVKVLQLSVEKNMMPLSADQRVSEVDAARLIGMEPGSLKNLRAEGGAPPSYRVPVNGQRISYRLLDLAIWIEKRREDW
jgi:hypothetical protein